MRSIHQFELDHVRSSHASLIRAGLSNTGTGLTKRHPKSQTESTQRRTSLRRPHPTGKGWREDTSDTPQQRRLHPNTGEQTDPSGMVYLRSRYYTPNDGRFNTRDTWMGDYNIPLSLNRWMYVEGNPVNYVDPEGQYRWSCNTDAKRIATAKNAVPISSTDALNTYTTAGIAVQCFGGDITWPWNDINYSGLGIAQITQKEAETAYGEPIKWIVNGVVQKDENGKAIIRGYGCRIDDYDYRPKDKDWSAQYMRRRIQLSVDKCKFCTERDKFIVAALAQNGPGFTVDNVEAIRNNYLSNNQIQWKVWYADRSRDSKSEYRAQWRLFYKFAKKLNEDGYYLPPNILNDEIIIWLKNQ